MRMQSRYFLIAVCLLLSACQDNNAVKKKVHHHQKVIARTPPEQLKEPVYTDSIGIAAVGDLMLGSSYPDQKTLPPDSGKKSFAAALTSLRGTDITFGNLEGTLLNSGVPAHFKMHLLSKAYLFRMPEYDGTILKAAGFNVLSVANNHIGDFGDNGRLNTMKVLDNLHINYGGLLSHPSAIFKINGVTYGFCAFAPNSQTLPMLDLDSVRQTIAALKQQCNVVLVSFHGGGEGKAFEHVPFKTESYFNVKRGNVHLFAHTAIDAGADLVLGNGPHVCRAIELYKNRLIAYSLGNFCTYRDVNVSGICGLAPLLKIYINKKGEFLNGQIISFRQTHDKGLLKDSLNGAAHRIKLLTEHDFPVSHLKISAKGEIIPDQSKLDKPFAGK